MKAFRVLILMVGMLCTCAAVMAVAEDGAPNPGWPPPNPGLVQR